MGKVQGASSLDRKLKRFPERVKAEVRIAVEAAAGEVVGAQRSLAPKGKTGKLARSIVYSMGNEDLPKYATLKGGASGRGDPETTAIITAGNSGVRYAHLVEFGTAPHVQGGIFEGSDPAVMHPGTQPQPFFYPGYRLTRKRTKGRISRAVNKAAKKVAS